MKIQTKLLALLVTLGSSICLPFASAAIVGVDLGTGLPPATLGGYTMSSFEPGVIAGESYTALIASGSGTGGGGGSWATWGQSYTGAVHVSLSDQPLTLLLSGVHAIYFYMEPNRFSDFVMSATDSSGAFVSTVINGFHGSSAVGFYATAGEFLSSITVTCSDTSGFAVGEFGIDDGSVRGQIGRVPEVTSTLALFGGMMVILAGIRRRVA